MAQGLIIKADIDSSRAIKLLDEIIDRTGSPLPVYKEIGEYVVASTLRRFETQRDPKGHKWVALSMPYRRAKMRAGYGDKIGTRTGKFRNSIIHQENDKEIVVGTNVHSADGYPYPAAFQKRRAVFGINAADIKGIEKLMAAFLEEG